MSTIHKIMVYTLMQVVFAGRCLVMRLLSDILSVHVHHRYTTFAKSEPEFKDLAFDRKQKSFDRNGPGCKILRESVEEAVTL